MNKRRRFQAKRRRAEARRRDGMLNRLADRLALHPRAFEIAREPFKAVKMDVLYGHGTIQRISDHELSELYRRFLA